LKWPRDEDEAMVIEVDDDEVPTQGKGKRNTHNKELNLVLGSHPRPTGFLNTLGS
jgi:hypothetical protein